MEQTNTYPEYWNQFKNAFSCFFNSLEPDRILEPHYINIIYSDHIPHLQISRITERAITEIELFLSTATNYTLAQRIITDALNEIDRKDLKIYSIFLARMYELHDDTWHMKKEFAYRDENSSKEDMRIWSLYNHYKYIRSPYHHLRDWFYKFLGGSSAGVFSRIVEDKLNDDAKNNVDIQPAKDDPKINNESETVQLDRYDINFWNDSAKALFIYLIENYTGSTGRQRYANIFHFIKGLDLFIGKTEIKFNFSHDTYKEMIKHVFQIEIKKLDKKSNYETQQRIMSGLYSSWMKQTKTN